MSETVILVPEPEPDPSPEPAADHGIEIGRLQAENEELRRKLEEMEERVSIAERNANDAVDIALSQPAPEPEPDWETFRDPAYEEEVLLKFPKARTPNSSV